MLRHAPDDTMWLVRGGGLSILGGLLMLPIGAVFVMTATVFMQQGMGDLVEVVSILLFGLLVLGAALYGLFWRGGITLNRQARTVTAWRRMLVPLGTKEYSLDNFEHVTLSRTMLTNGSWVQAAGVVYPVSLTSTSGTPLLIDQPTKEAKARQLAQQLAEYLHVPLVDTLRADAPGNVVPRSVKDDVQPS